MTSSIRAGKASVLKFLALIWAGLSVSILLSPAAHAADIRFQRAYQGSFSGQSFTTTTILNADPGSIRFSDGGTQRQFQNTSGTLHYTIGGVPYSEVGVLNARYPNGNVMIDAVAFSGTGGNRLLILGGSYTEGTSYSGSSNAIVDKLNEYVTATAPDPASSILQVNGGSSASAIIGQNVSIVATIKLSSGTPISGAVVTLSASPSGTSTISPATATTNSSGQATFTVQGTSAGTVTYGATASANGTTTSSGTVSVSFTAQRSAANTTASVPGGTAGVATTITIAVKDTSGNAVVGAATGLAAAIGGTNAGAAASAIADLGGGNYQFTYTPLVGGTDTVAITLDGSAISGSPYQSVVAAPTLAIAPAAGGLPGGTVGTGYSQTLTASGGAAPYSYSASGLPAGLTIDPATGVISGTPTQDGSFTVTVSVTDANGAAGSTSYTVVIAVQAPSAGAVTATVAANSSGNAITLDLGGGAAASVTVASAPAHGTASVAGTSISYTPNAGYSGADSFTYTATNATGTSAPATVTITVTAPTLAIAPAAGGLPGGTVGTGYSQTLTASGGAAPYSYSASGLPAGLTIDPATGVISGTPTQDGSFTVTVSVTDANGAAGSTSYTVVIAVQAPSAGAVTATVAANSSGNAITLDLGGGAAASVTVASAPAHGTASVAGTSISYTPNAGYSGADSFTYTATNATGTSAPATVTITVTAPTLAIAPAAGGLPGGTVGTAYSQTLTASGGTSPYSYSASGLPAGLTIDPATGVISGTPTQDGSFTVTVSVTDANGAAGSASYTVVIAVQAPSAGAVTATVAANSSGNAITLDLGGGAAASVTVASAPAHGTASVAGTSISYTPNAGYSGADSFTYTATNATGTSAPATVTITVTAPTLEIAPAAGGLPGGTVGTAYSQTLTASGGTSPYSYSASGLPAGLTIDPATGVISGTPTQDGSFTVTVSVTDANGAAGSTSYTVVIAVQAPSAGAVTATVAANSSGNAITLDLGGGAAASVTVASAPAHGTASVAGTSISYTPNAGYSGADSFTYTATNATGTSAPATVTITVTAPTLAIAPAAGGLPGGTVGTAYSQTLTASGGTSPYSYSASGLPAGLAIDPATGVISGTPTQDGSFTVTVSVTDANGAAGSASYTVVIAPAPVPPVPVPAPPVAANSTSTSVPANTQTAAGQFVSINLTSLVSGEYTDIAIVTQPRHGRVELRRTLAMHLGGGGFLSMAAAGLSAVTIPSQVVAVYTPDPYFQGSDSFQFAASGPGGSSAPATVVIEVVGAAPVAQPKVASTLDGQAVTIDLTEGAANGPFSAATLVGVAPADKAAVRILPGSGSAAGTFRMEVTPVARFQGSVAITYTLTSAFGTSQPAIVTVNVQRRPDPSQDTVVQAISDAQAEGTRRFARAQMANVMQRVESLHGDCRRSSNGLRLSSSDGAADLQDGAGVADVAASGAEDETGISAPAADEQACGGPVAIWSGGTIDISTRDAASGRARISAGSAGLTAGVDVRVSDGITIGIAGGLGHETARIANGEGRVGSDASILAVYGSLAPSPGVFVDAALARGWTSFETQRVVEPVQSLATGLRNGSFTAGAITAGFDKVSGAVSWSLYGRADILRGVLDAYAEAGAGAYDLRFDERAIHSTTGVLGFRLGFIRPMATGTATLSLRGEWLHEFSGGDAQGVDYADVAGAAIYAMPTRGWSREQFSLAPTVLLVLPKGWEIASDLGLRIGGDELAITTGMLARKRF